MPLFEVAIIQKLTKKEAEEGTGSEKLVYGPKFVLAKDGQAAALSAILGEDKPVKIDISRCEVLVRPFA
jgi:hypothetical protein